jgi:hypothetical protein
MMNGLGKWRESVLECVNTQVLLLAGYVPKV